MIICCRVPGEYEVMVELQLHVCKVLSTELPVPAVQNMGKSEANRRSYRDLGF